MRLQLTEHRRTDQKDQYRQSPEITAPKWALPEPAAIKHSVSVCLDNIKNRIDPH